MAIVRENVEGEYSEIGGRLYRGTDAEAAVQESVFTRRGVDRVLRYAFDLAKERRRHVTSATKSNGIVHTMPFWDERFAVMKADYPDVKTAQYHIDILTAHFVRDPSRFDVVVGSNLFGDILSDLGPAVTGTIGIAPSANLDPTKQHPSMFEPVHGSAPDIAGEGIANPDRHDLVGRDDAGAPGPQGGARRDRGRDRARPGRRPRPHPRHGRARHDRGAGARDRGGDLRIRQPYTTAFGTAGRIDAGRPARAPAKWAVETVAPPIRT